MSTRLRAVLAAIDTLNAKDPNTEIFEGRDFPTELLYSERMSARLASLCPNASEELQIAARAQHVQRWLSPRSNYPDGKAGYYRWRTELGKMHARVAAELMREQDYADASIARVETLLTKQGIKQNDEVQALEDIACLVFLEHYFLPFAAKHPESKVIDIVQKTWKKMSSSGQAAALKLALPEQAQALVQKALAS